MSSPTESERRLILSLGGFFAWLLSFPVFGPAMNAAAAEAGINVPSLLTTFLPSHAISLFIVGRSGLVTHPRHRLITKLAVAGSGAISCLIPLIPAYLWPAATGLLGVIAAVPVISFAPYIVSVPSLNRRGWVLGLCMALANVFLYILTACSPLYGSLWGVKSPVYIASLFLVLPLTVDLKPEDKLHEHWPDQSAPRFTWHLVYLLFTFYAVAGLAYQLVYPPELGTNPAIAAIGVTPYIVGVMVLGIAVDKTQSYSWLVPAAVATMGTSLALYPLAGATLAQVASHLLIQFGYAVCDLFLWLYLAHSSEPGLASRRFGSGLSLNIGAMFLGLMLYEQWLALLSPPRIMAASVGVIGLFLAVPVWSRMPVPISIPSERMVAVDLNKLRMQVLKDFGLTPRQEEICLLLLDGLSNEEISGHLHISANTLKTHLRNLYGRTSTQNRTDLILLIMNRVEGLAENKNTSVEGD